MDSWIDIDFIWEARYVADWCVPSDITYTNKPERLNIVVQEEYKLLLNKWCKSQISYDSRRNSEKVYDLARRIENAGTKTLNVELLSEHNTIDSNKQQLKSDIGYEIRDSLHSTFTQIFIPFM